MGWVQVGSDAEDSKAEGSDAEDSGAEDSGAEDPDAEESGGREACCGTTLYEGHKDRPVAPNRVPIPVCVCVLYGGLARDGALTAAMPAPPSCCQQPPRL